MRGGECVILYMMCVKVGKLRVKWVKLGEIVGNVVKLGEILGKMGEIWVNVVVNAGDRRGWRGWQGWRGRNG